MIRDTLQLFYRAARHGLIVLAIVTSPYVTSAQTSQNRQVQASDQPSAKGEKQKSPRFQSSADFALGSVDEDLFLMLYVEQSFAHKGFELQLSGPFRFRIHDNAPDDSPGLREQDWDQASDWARILRSLSFNYSREDVRLSLKLGELNGVSMGHGTVISQYFNSTDMDYYQGGLLFKGDTAGTGLEYLMSNVVSPAVFSGRLFSAPFAWFSSKKLARHFETGVTLLVDRGVPRRALDSGRTSIVIVGGDVSMRFIDLPRAISTVYADVAGLDGSGGIHTGLAGNFQLSSRRRFLLSAQLEYRYCGEDYYPALINPFYDYNRYWFTLDPATDEINTLAEHLSNPRMNTNPAHGFMLETGMDFDQKAGFLIRYDYQNQNRPHWLLFQLSVTPITSLSIRVFYAGQDIVGGSRIFSSDALMGLSISHRVIGPLRLFTEFQRRFRSIETEQVARANEFSGGAGVVFSY